MLLKDPVNGNNVLLKELFDISASGTVEEIVNATLQLLRLSSKELKQVGLHPAQHLPYYPGGKVFHRKTQTPIPRWRSWRRWRRRLMQMIYNLAVKMKHQQRSTKPGTRNQSLFKNWKIFLNLSSICEEASFVIIMCRILFCEHYVQNTLLW